MPPPLRLQRMSIILYAYLMNVVSTCIYVRSLYLVTVADHGDLEYLKKECPLLFPAVS